MESRYWQQEAKLEGAVGQGSNIMNIHIPLKSGTNKKDQPGVGGAIYSHNDVRGFNT